jgi:HSP20 family protein
MEKKVYLLFLEGKSMYKSTKDRQKKSLDFDAFRKNSVSMIFPKRRTRSYTSPNLPSHNIIIVDINNTIPKSSEAICNKNKTTTMALSRYWNRPLFGGFDDSLFPREFFEDPFKDFLMPVVPNLNRPQGLSLLRTSPGYEIHEMDGKYQIAVDVPGVKKDDITVNVEDEGRILRITGGRKVVREGKTSETKFEKRFTIGDNVDLEKMSANLSDGVLTLTAPKKEETKPKTRTIMITEGN